MEDFRSKVKEQMVGIRKSCAGYPELQAMLGTYEKFLMAVADEADTPKGISLPTIVLLDAATRGVSECIQASQMSHAIVNMLEQARDAEENENLGKADVDIPDSLKKFFN